MAQVNRQETRAWRSPGPDSGFIWFLGFIGAFIYYLQTVNSFMDGVIAFLKAIVWPAFLVYKLLS